MATVEIIDDDLVAGKIGIPLVECLWSEGAHIDAETPCFGKNGPDSSGCGGPIVVVDAIDDRHPDLCIGESRQPHQATRKRDRARDTHRCNLSWVSNIASRGAGQ